MNLLILSGVASAINYIQSLSGTPDITLFVSDCDPYCPGLYMPGVTPVLLPRARDTGNYRPKLAKALEEHRIDALIPTSDYDVEAVVHWLHEGWRPPVALFSPPFESFARLGDKARLADHLSRNFPEAIPKSFGFNADPSSLPYPVVVKPANMSGGKGVAICNNREALRAACARLIKTYGQDVLIQEYIPGATYVLTMIYDHAGVPVVCAGMRSHLTFFTWGGGGMAGEMVNDPELAELARALVADAGGWRGPINLEFRRHEKTGRFMLMEANCRLNGYSYLTTMNGLNLPRMAVDTLLGRAIPESVAPAVEKRRNFLIGYREIPVESFLSQ